jgi:hypothetical protein
VDSLEKHFQRLDGKNIRTADFGSLHEDISAIYDALSQIKGIQYTGAPKLMHLRNRELFVMWDAYIRGLKPRKAYERLDVVKHGDWEVKKYGSSADDYVQYLKDMQKRFAGVSFGDERKTFAKAIDEFNYVSITLPIQRAERAASRSSAAEPAAVTADEQSIGTVNTETFRKALQRVLTEAQGSFVDVTSGTLYRSVGGRMGKDSNLASCCNAMTSAMQPGDSVLHSPPKGKGATLTIRYVLPR